MKAETQTPRLILKKMRVSFILISSLLFLEISALAKT
jgi:hypothetical protein